MPRLRSPLRPANLLRAPLRSPIELGDDDGAFPIFPGLVGHYDASAPGAFDVTGDGDTITTWFDISGNNNDATANGTPTLELNEQNGLPGVDFVPASSEYFDIGDNAAFENQNWTIFGVINRDVTGTGHAVCCLQHQIDGPSGIAGVAFCTDPDRLRGVYDNGSFFETPASVPPDTIPASPAIVTFDKSGTALTLLHNLDVIASQTGDANVDYNTITTKRTLIGAEWRDPGAGGTVRRFDGLYHELLVYDNSLSVARRNATISALGTKWGIIV